MEKFIDIRKQIEQVPLYQELYGDLLKKIHSEKDLEKLPELSKQSIAKDFPQKWLTPQLKKAIEENSFEYMTTSGTTSERMQLIRPKNWWFGEEERLYRHLQSAFPQHTSMQSKAILTTAICSNTLCYKEAPPFEQRIVNGILHLNISEDPNGWQEKDIQRIVDEIDRFEPQCLQADPIYLAIFFNKLAQYKIKFPSWKPLLLSLTYEYATKKSLEIIQKYWDVPIVFLYGITEVGFIFFQPMGKKLCPISDSIYFQFKPFDQKENIFELVVTSFRNPFMPFVNYNTKDLFSLEKTTFFPQKMIGRTKDLIYSEKDEPITIEIIDNALSSIPSNLFLYSLDFHLPQKILFHFTTMDHLSLSSSKELLYQLSKLFGPKYTIEFLHEKAIHPSPSGKFSLIQK